MASKIRSQFGGVVNLGVSTPIVPLRADVPDKAITAPSSAPAEPEIIVRADPHFSTPVPRGIPLVDTRAIEPVRAAEILPETGPAFGDYSRLASIPPAPGDDAGGSDVSYSFGGYQSPVVTVNAARFDLAGEVYRKIKAVFTDPPEGKTPYTLADKVGHCLVTQAFRRMASLARSSAETAVGDPLGRAIKEILPTTACRIGGQSLSIEPGAQGSAGVTVNVGAPSLLRPNTGTVSTWLSIGGSPSNPSLRAGLEYRF